MRFPKQEYWSGLPFPSLKDLPDPGIKTASPALQADSLPAYILIYMCVCVYICSQIFVYMLFQILFHYRLFYKILSIVPCAIQ